MAGTVPGLPMWHPSTLTLATLILAMLTLLTAGAASAHPHVFIMARSELVYDGGNFIGVDQHWTFDESYSAFAVQGLDPRKDGVLTRDDLAALAKVNIESLAEFEYFSFGKSSGRKLEFGQPENYWLDYRAEKLTLNFTLPVKVPVASRTLTFQVYDPSYFVAFAFDGTNAVSLRNAAEGCSVTMKTPPQFNAGGSKTLSGDFFNQLNAGSDFGGGLADRALVTCP